MSTSDDFDPEADDRVRLSVELTSTTLSAEDISRVLGIEPDKSWNKGDRRKAVADTTHPAAFYDFSRWSLASRLPPTASDDEHLDHLWSRVSATLERVPELDGQATICLSFYRNLDGRSYQQHGFEVSSEWIQLLARIGGFIDVDQYILRDGPQADD